MAARVNVKFVVLLSVALVLVMAAVVWAAMTVVLKSGEDYAQRAVELEQAGDYKEAAKSWGRAVGHDSTRIDWLTSWREALENIDHPTDAEYSTDMRMRQGILRTIADVKRTDLDAHREYLDQLSLLILVSGARAEEFTLIDTEVERALLGYPDQASPERGQIRRYRGIVGTNALARGVELSDEEIETIRDDLVVALESDPGDEQALGALVQVDASRADAAIRDRRPEDAEQIWNGLTAIADAFVETNPGSIRGRILQANIGLGADNARINKLGLFGSDLTQARMDAVRQLEPVARDIYESYMTAPPERTGHLAASETASLLQRALQGDATDLIVNVWNRTLEQHPDDVLVIQSRAAFLRSISRYQEAIDSYQRLRELPRPPVSAEGHLLVNLKQQASVAMGACAYEQWNTRMTNAQSLERGSDERQAMLESAEEALAHAITYRDQAVNDLPEDEPSLVLLNARIAFAEGDIPAADRLARRYNEAFAEQSPDGLRIAAQIAERLGNVGEQKRLLERLVQLNPGDVRSMLELAAVEMNLKNYQSAQGLYEIAADLRPDIDFISNRLSTINALLGDSRMDDPYETAIVQAQIAADEGDFDRAIEVLEAVLRDQGPPDHIRIHTVLANMLLGTGRVDRAIEVADAGLEIDPGSRSLAIIKRQAAVGDDLESADAFIDSLEISETQKNLRKYRLRVEQGQDEAAGAFLEAARIASPDDRSVLLASFEHALRTGDMDAARRIMADSEGKDIDGANGLTLRARLDIAEGKYEEAERTLRAAVERGSLNATTLSLLGRVQALQGDTFAAIESFGRAREIRPNEISYTNDYVRALAGAGQQTAALEAARESLDLGRNNDDFRQLWLALEGAVGSKQIAYDERVALAQIEPDNQANAAALIQLCIDLRRFDEARDRLDEARAEGDNLTFCQLDALWHLQRGDLEGAANVYNEFLISDAEGADSPAAYVAYGAFLIDNGQLDAGLTTLRQARRLQSEANPIVDSELARRLFEAGRYTEAADVLESVADGPAADSDTGKSARNLLIETYTRLREWDAAEARLNQLSDDQLDELTTRMLRVEVARGRGNSAQARQLLDDTITAYPNEPLPYLRRGTLLMTEGSLLRDAVEDLTRAIELDPANVDAFRFRSMAHARLGMATEAANDIIAATRARPFDDQMRIAAASQLISSGREDLAADVIDEGLERQAGNLRLLYNAGRLFANADAHQRAVQYLQSAWDQSKDDTIASMLITSMLELPRPDLRGARQITSDAALDQASPAVLMMRARIESAADNRPATESLLTEVYRTNRDNPAILVAWAGTLTELLDTRDNALDYLTRLDAAESLSPWGRFARARVLAREEDGRSQASDILSPLTNSGNQALRLASFRLRSLIAYEAGDFEAAADDMRSGLEISPEDPELNNNLAYVLAIELDRAAEAVPLAQLAVERNPENRGFLDTLGSVYIRAGEPAKAIAPLERALTLATTDAERAPVLVHLARARLETGDRPAAEDAANEAQRITDSLDEPDENTQAELRSVLDAIAEQR